MKEIPKQCIFFLLSILACASCSKQSKGEVASSLANDAALSIRFEQARVFVSAETDTIKLYTWLIKDSAVSNGSVYRLPIHEQIFNANINKAEKDSMYRWVKKLIAAPVKQMRFCTDYVGYINLAIVSRQVRQECTYTSVCEWESLSPESQKLNIIIKSKFANF